MPELPPKVEAILNPKEIDMNESKVIYEIKLHKSLILVLWAFAIGILLIGLPKSVFIPEALAQMAANPTIILRVQECTGGGMQITACQGLDIDD